MMAVALFLAVGILGTCIAAYWTILIGIAGAPGTFLGEIPTRNLPLEKKPSSWLWWVGLILVIIGQVYASLWFACLVMTVIRAYSADMAFVAKLFLWPLALIVSTMPPWFAMRDAISTPEENRNLQHFAAAYTATIATILVFPLACFPKLMGPWSWLIIEHARPN